jgi:hypothetical protein
MANYTDEKGATQAIVGLGVCPKCWADQGRIDTADCSAVSPITWEALLARVA